MKKTFISIFTMLYILWSLGASAQTLVFHLTNKTTVDVELTSAFNMYNENGKTIIIFADGKTEEFSQDDILNVTYRETRGDVNRDNTVDVADISTIIDIMAGKYDDPNNNETSYNMCPDDHHPHMIDLGLPSGTKWACCNVGASAPEQFGGYYAWGETIEKTYYGPSTYQYSIESSNGIWNDEATGNNYEPVYIGSDIAGTEYDVATVKWGSSWRMPTWEQGEELIKNTTSEWTTMNGVNGRKITGSNGGFVFLPAAGWWGGTLAGGLGQYWSSTYSGNDPRCSYFLSIHYGDANWYGDGNRSSGISVRPVCQNR